MVDEAHIVFAMYCVKNGFSNNSVDDFGDVLKRMCQTNPVSSKFQMGRTKLQYMVNHGLFPHFKQMILDEILKSPFMTVLFDESLNDSIQKSEMDILVRYWNEGENKVTVRYWTAKFLVHTCCDDFVAVLHDGLTELEETKMIQISMDGPNTNLKLLREIQDERQNNKLSSLIDIGSCSLHLIHGAFKTGSEKSSWDLHKILKGAFTLLHDSPARRDDYYNLTGSDEYPLQFCGTRWVEDKKVAEKLVTLWPNMIKLFDFWKTLTKSKRPDSNSYHNVKKGIDDPLTVPKLCFFFISCRVTSTLSDSFSRRWAHATLPLQ
jgi:hypothetical protein